MIQFTNDEIVKQPITEDLLTNATPAQLTCYCSMDVVTLSKKAKMH